MSRTRMRPPRGAAIAVVVCLTGHQPVVWASQAPSSQAPAPQTAPATPIVVTETVIVTTPMPGAETPRDDVPTPVQTLTAAQIDASGALDVSDALNRRLNGIFLNEVQNNPFQPDLNYRGFTASPLLGTPQGLSVYLDGVRLNQPFGDVVSWDLIPRIAIASGTLLPGSNPLFGLNTLGGALALDTKSGRSHPRTTVQTTYGQNARRQLELEHGGGTRGNRLHWYLAGTLFAEDGWRTDSPSDVRQGFGKLAWDVDGGRVMLSAAHAATSLTGNGLQDVQLLDRDYTSVYTKPDVTDNRSTMLNLSAQRTLRGGWSLSATAYARRLRTSTLNGDINEESLEESVYQPGAAERAALAAAGYGAIPAAGLDASNTPFPFLRCVGQVLLNDEPAETCNGLLNRTRNMQHNGGFTGQIVRRAPMGAGDHMTVIGAALDHSRMSFAQSTELGYLNPDRSVTGTGAFGDGVNGGEIDREPYDARVDLTGRVTTWSLFATETLSLGARARVTAAARYNRTTLRNRDGINPGGGPRSLDGDHVFQRLNPSAGITIALPGRSTAYVNYAEGSRAATSIELGCANPEQPCKLPNAMAGDPPLDQVVTRTVEAGLRGTAAGVEWNAGVFRAGNDDDILFALSDRTGFGYFRNFGRTRRQGVELGLRRHIGRVELGLGYTFLDATFQSAETVNGEGNSANDEAEDGLPGLDGEIAIEPGHRLPLVPRHLFKAFGTVAVTRRLGVDLTLVSSGAAYARGNENNAHEPDGVYYLGNGFSGGYAVVHLGARYTLARRLELIGQVNNLFDRQYATAAQLGPAGFTSAGTFAARPFPAVNGEFPVTRTTFLAPGAPRRAWFGVRVRF